MCQSSRSKNVFNLISGLAFGQNNKQVKKIEPFIDISSNPQLKEKSDYKINISVKVKKNLLEELFQNASDISDWKSTNDDARIICKLCKYYLDT